jgi:hypothetical protein
MHTFMHWFIDDLAPGSWFITLLIGNIFWGWFTKRRCSDEQIIRDERTTCANWWRVELRKAETRLSIRRLKTKYEEDLARDITAIKDGTAR